MGGFSRLQLSALFILVAFYLLGVGFREWRTQRPLPAIDQRTMARFKFVADSLNEIKHKTIKSKKRVKKHRKKLARKININSAPVQDLILLPGIGQTLAKRIVKYRSDHGPFHTDKDIKKVKGIGEKKFLLIKENIILH